MTTPTDADRSPIRDPWLYAAAMAATFLLANVLFATVKVDPEGVRAGLDGRVASWVSAHRAEFPAATRVALAVTLLGNPEVATPAVFAIALLILALHRLHVLGAGRREAVFWLIVAAGGRLLSVGLKLWFRRDRPPVAGRLLPETSYSFPSGHAMFAGVSLVLLAGVIVRASNRRWQAATGLAAASALMVAVAGSRAWLGVHYATDILAGFALGSFWAGACHAIRFARRGRLTADSAADIVRSRGAGGG